MERKTVDAINKRKYLVLGSVFLACLMLSFAAIIFFGSNKLLRLGYSVETYFNESVQGIEVGTAVKHRGVRVGVVDEITFLGDEYPDVSLEWRRYILIRFKIDRSEIIDQDFLKTLIAEGLHARILPQGISGLSYIELDYIDQERSRKDTIPDWEPDFIYIPASLGLFNSISSTIQKLSSDLDRADLESAFQNLNIILKDVSREIKKSDVGATVINVDGLVTELRRTNKIVQTILVDNSVSIRETISDLRKIARNAEELTEKAKQYPAYVFFGDPPARNRRQ